MANVAEILWEVRRHRGFLKTLDLQLLAPPDHVLGPAAASYRNHEVLPGRILLCLDIPVLQQASDRGRPHLDMSDLLAQITMTKSL